MTTPATRPLNAQEKWSEKASYNVLRGIVSGAMATLYVYLQHNYAGADEQVNTELRNALAHLDAANVRLYEITRSTPEELEAFDKLQPISCREIAINPPNPLADLLKQLLGEAPAEPTTLTDGLDVNMKPAKE